MAKNTNMDSTESDNGILNSNSLPIVADCEGCGVCCFHMGYPAYVLPREPMTDLEIDADPKLVAEVAKDPRRRDELKAGHPGEANWHSMPDDLRQEWQAYVDGYQLPKYGDGPETFDGPCVWFNMESRQCKNHEHRPNICRDFETGSPECHEWRAYYQDRILLKRPEAN